MKVVLKLERDSDNSFDTDNQVSVVSTKDTVTIELESPRREIVLKRDQLAKALQFIVE